MNEQEVRELIEEADAAYCSHEDGDSVQMRAGFFGEVADALRTMLASVAPQQAAQEGGCVEKVDSARLREMADYDDALTRGHEAASMAREILSLHAAQPLAEAAVRLADAVAAGNPRQDDLSIDGFVALRSYRAAKSSAATGAQSNQAGAEALTAEEMACEIDLTNNPHAVRGDITKQIRAAVAAEGLRVKAECEAETEQARAEGRQQINQWKGFYETQLTWRQDAEHRLRERDVKIADIEAKLAAAEQRVRKLLLRLEWSDSHSEGDFDRCPICRAARPWARPTDSTDYHKPDCAMRAALLPGEGAAADWKALEALMNPSPRVGRTVSLTPTHEGGYVIHIFDVSGSFRGPTLSAAVQAAVEAKA